MLQVADTPTRRHAATVARRHGGDRVGVPDRQVTCAEVAVHGIVVLVIPDNASLPRPWSSRATKRLSTVGPLFILVPQDLLITTTITAER